MRLLVIRTSAMGDVALVTPVLRELLKRFPEVEITMLTRSVFKSFFSQSDKLSVLAPDFKSRHKGIRGIFTLYRDIMKIGHIDYVIDLHDVIRSKILRLLFRSAGVPVSVIDKGRKEKQDLIKGKRKVQLKHSVKRYCEAFSKAGFDLDPIDKKNIFPGPAALIKADELLTRGVGLNVGVAPFARHKLKMWPVESMIRLLNMISSDRDATFFLFGGKEESQQLDGFSTKVKGSVNLSGTLTLDEELALMSKLDFMIAMDSSNMHMAALVGTKVISIWGGTDPLSGFGAWMQPENYEIKIPVNELTCRPCTTYGKGECRRGDFACMNWLTPELVLKRIEESGVLKKSPFEGGPGDVNS